MAKSAEEKDNAHVLICIMPKLLLERMPGKKDTKSKPQSAKVRRISGRSLQRQFTAAKLVRWDSGPEAQRAMLLEFLARPSVKMDYKKDPVRLDNQRRAKELAARGRFKDALSTLINSGAHSLSPEIVEILKRQHPAAPTPPEVTLEIQPLDPTLASNRQHLAVEVVAPFQLDPEDTEKLEKAIMSFPDGSGGGRDGLYPQILKDSLKIKVPEYKQRYLKYLSLFVNSCLDGSTSTSIMPLFCSATMIPLKKPNTNTPRPIAVGLTLRRLVSKLAAKEGERAAAPLFAGQQFGVGTKLGAEAIVHSLRYLLEHREENQPWDPNVFVLLVDFSNAFNCVDRLKLFAAVRMHCPSLSKWVESCYQNGSWIFMTDGSHPFDSNSGVQQGDPLGPLLFSLVLQIVIKIIKERWPNLEINAWYLDDGTLVGTKEDLLQILTFLKSEGPNYGLFLNTTKTIVWSPLHGSDFSSFNSLAEGVTSAGVKTLGAPFGTREQCDKLLDSKISKIEQIMDEICALPDTHLKVTLLQKCGVFPRICYTLRTAPGSSLPSTLKRMDNAAFLATRSILAHDAVLHDWHHKRLHLPRHFSGLNFPHPSIVSLSAYTGSAFQSISLQAVILNKDPATLLDRYNNFILPTFNNSLEPSLRVAPISNVNDIKNQHMLSRIQASNIFKNDVLNSPDPRMSNDDKKCAIACAHEDAVNIFQVNPTRSDYHNNELANHEMDIAVRLYLNLPVYAKEVKCPFCSKGILDVAGMHAIACAGKGDCNNRHNALQNLIHEWCIALGFDAHKEVGGLLPPKMDGSGKRLDNLISGFLNAGDAGLDVTITHGFNDSNILFNNFKAESPILAKHNEKDDKYKTICYDRKIHFIPVVFTHLGGLGKGTILVLKAIARGQAAKAQITTTVAMERLRSAIAVSLAKRQAFAIQSRGDAQSVLFTNFPLSSFPKIEIINSPPASPSPLIPQPQPQPQSLSLSPIVNINIIEI